MRNDPTYDPKEIKANPVWRVANILSEWYNDNAPLGWGNYITPAEQIIAALTPEDVKKDA